jgi:hypothetical protein
MARAGAVFDDHFDVFQQLGELGRQLVERLDHDSFKGLLIHSNFLAAAIARG